MEPPPIRVSGKTLRKHVRFSGAPATPNAPWLAPARCRWGLLRRRPGSVARRPGRRWSRRWRRVPLWLVGGLNPPEKYEFVNWDDDIPNIWDNKNVPNHQPDKILIHTRTSKRIPLEVVMPHRILQVLQFATRTSQSLRASKTLHDIFKICIQNDLTKYFDKNHQEPLKASHKNFHPRTSKTISSTSSSRALLKNKHVGIFARLQDFRTSTIKLEPHWCNKVFNC